MNGYMISKHGSVAHIFVTWTRVPGRARVMCERNIMNGRQVSDPGFLPICKQCTRKQ